MIHTRLFIFCLVLVFLQAQPTATLKSFAYSKYEKYVSKNGMQIASQPSCPGIFKKKFLFV